jgi:hypothetical protein
MDSASEEDLAAVNGVLETNAGEREAITADVPAAKVQLDQLNGELAKLQSLLEQGARLKPTWKMSHNELLAYVLKQDHSLAARQWGYACQQNDPDSRRRCDVGMQQAQAQALNEVEVIESGQECSDAPKDKYGAPVGKCQSVWMANGYGQAEGLAYNNTPELKAKIKTAQQQINAANAAVAAFDNQVAKTKALAEAIAANIDKIKATEDAKAQEKQREVDAAAAKVREAQAEAEAKAKAEQAAKEAEADQARAAEEQKAAAETAKIEQEAAAKRAEAARIRQQAADHIKVGADAEAAAKAAEAAAAQTEHDAEIAKEIAKAPAPAPKRVWWVVYANTPRCVTATEAQMPSPAELVEKANGKIDDRGVFVNVTATFGDDVQTIAYFRTKEGCEAEKDRIAQAQADKSHALDQYR